MVQALKRELQMTDRRMYWLKEQYLQLFYDNDCQGPLIVDAIRIFGGRDWAATTSAAGTSPPDNGTLRRGTSTKFRKKRSIGNLQVSVRCWSIESFCKIPIPMDNEPFCVCAQNDSSWISLLGVCKSSLMTDVPFVCLVLFFLQVGFDLVKE